MLCLLIGAGSVGVVPYYSARPAEVAVALVGVAAIAVAWLLPNERWPRWVLTLPAFAFFPVFVLLRDATGGGLSGLAPLVALPVLWLALYAGRLALVVAGALTALAFLLPLILVGGQDYPLAEWRRGVLWLAVVWLVVPAVQRVVRALRDREAELTEAVDDLNAATRQWETFADELADTVVVIADGDLRYQQVAGAGAMRIGVEGWVGKTLHETSSATNVAMLEPLYREALAGRSGSCELGATNGGAPHQVSVVPFTLHGEPAIMVVARDVTLAQQREHQIRALGAQVEQLVEESPIGVAVADADGRLIRMNPALRRICGLEESAEPAAGGRWTLALLGVDHSGRDLAETVASAPNGHLHEDVVRVLDDGEARVHAVHVVPLIATDASGGSYLVNVHDVTERHRAETRLRHLATHDGLTDLANRRRFDEVLAEHVLTGGTDDRGAVIVFDLDHFKEANDARGHEAGDRILAAVAEAATGLVRTSDLVARLGGDEFAILLPDADRLHAETIASRVVAAVRDRVAREVPGLARAVTVSVGVVMVADALGAGGDVLATADRTMYEAKRRGRDTFAVDHQTPPAPAAAPATETDH